ncbi:hypothetical protein [Novosphingopyxis baekryungensis]|uniref:hypothetical protein n=1 Tax=Novosphingopyxis baekryungensis TaxID=279369 RepID=UPI001FE0B966|nr:hypothetical protein [Novosphingopyxis baekryungensis]
MVIKQIGQMWLCGTDLLSLGGQDEPLGLSPEMAAWQGFENVEDLAGIFLVFDQIAKMSQRLERSEARFLAAWMNHWLRSGRQDRGRC